MKRGFSFHWIPGNNLRFICPDGMLVELDVNCDIPYLDQAVRSVLLKLPFARISSRVFLPL
jgi:hypothetical protein